MKKHACAALALLTAAALTLTGCDALSSLTGSDGYEEGRMGDTMETYFFDYTMNSAYLCSEYAGTIPSDGNVFLVAEVTVKNTDTRSIEMYDTDFQAQWGSEGEEDYRFPITTDMDTGEELAPLTEDQLPGTYPLAVDEEVTGLLVYEVPTGFQDFSISYMEYFDDDSTGDVYFVYFTPEDQTTPVSA